MLEFNQQYIEVVCYDVRNLLVGDRYQYYHPRLDDGRPLTALLEVLEIGTLFTPKPDGRGIPSTLFRVLECSAPRYLEHTWHLPIKHFTRLQQFKVMRPLR